MCCLFGLYDYKHQLTKHHKERIIKILGKNAEERGIDASGISYVENGEAVVAKAPLPMHRLKFKISGNPNVITGHTRLTTKGSQRDNRNNHPFISKLLGFTLSHNGMIINDDYLKESEDLPNTQIKTDSYVAVQLIEKSGVLNMKSIKDMVESLIGSYCFSILSCDEELYLVKGNNPLHIVDCYGYYIYASTRKILIDSLKKLKIRQYKEINIKPGTILRIDKSGVIDIEHFCSSVIDNDYNDYSFITYDFDRYGYDKKSDEYMQYLNYLKRFADELGLDEEEVSNMINDGYTLDDISEMLYDYSYGRYYYMDLTTEIGGDIYG